MRAPFGFCLLSKMFLMAASLREKKYRKKHGAFVCDGIKLFRELCLAGADIRMVFVNSGERERLLCAVSEGEKTLGREIDVQLVSPAVFSKITEENCPEGIVSVAGFFSWNTVTGGELALAADDRCLMLASLRDPGNLGTVARSALAFGVNRLILTADCADIYSPKTLRAAMGALFKLKADITTDAVKTIGFLRDAGRCVYAAELRPEAVSVLEADIRSRDVFVIGNEGSGIPWEISSAATGSVYIPISPLSESLNAATAASVLMWHQHAAEVAYGKR